MPVASERMSNPALGMFFFFHGLILRASRKSIGAATEQQKGAWQDARQGKEWVGMWEILKHATRRAKSKDGQCSTDMSISSIQTGMIHDWWIR